MQNLKIFAEKTFRSWRELPKYDPGARRQDSVKETLKFLGYTLGGISASTFTVDYIWNKYFRKSSTWDKEPMVICHDGHWGPSRGR